MTEVDCRECLRVECVSIRLALLHPRIAPEYSSVRYARGASPQRLEWRLASGFRNPRAIPQVGLEFRRIGSERWLVPIAVRDHGARALLEGSHRSLGHTTQFGRVGRWGLQLRAIGNAVLTDRLVNEFCPVVDI